MSRYFISFFLREAGHRKLRVRYLFYVEIQSRISVCQVLSIRVYHDGFATDSGYSERVKGTAALPDIGERQRPRSITQKDRGELCIA